jgi:hypothetical protein
MDVTGGRQVSGAQVGLVATLRSLFQFGCAMDVTGGRQVSGAQVGLVTTLRSLAVDQLSLGWGVRGLKGCICIQ